MLRILQHDANIFSYWQWHVQLKELVFISWWTGQSILEIRNNSLWNSKQKLIKFCQAFVLLIENISTQNKNEMGQFTVTHKNTSIFNI